MANDINRTPHQIVTKLKSKFSLTLGYLNQALNNPAQKYKIRVSANLMLVIRLQWISIPSKEEQKYYTY